MSLLIEGGKVLTPRGWLDPGFVLVEGSHIANVGTGVMPGSAEVTQRIDAAGGSVIPGLINGHTHITIDERDTVTPRRYYPRGEPAGILDAAVRGRRALERGITGFRDCNSPGAGAVALRDAFASGAMPGPRMFVSVQAICATGGHMHAISFEADGPDDVRRGVREQAKAGADFIKLVAEASSGGGAFVRPSLQLTVGEMRAGVDAAHRLGLRATAHAVSAAGVAGAVEAGVDSIEHGYQIEDRTLSEMAERGVWLVPTLSVHDQIVRRGPEAGYGPDRIDQSRRILGLAIENLGRAKAAGVRIACGSDAGSPLNPVWELSAELQAMVEGGFDPTEALVAATAGSAALLGADDRLGAITPGHVADVVVVDGDAAKDVKAVNQVRVVIKDGIVAVDRSNSIGTED
jgi:imidazolonepropionase-like amidohydrolase